MMHRRLAFIDTLRGIAVLAVLFQHVLEVIVQKSLRRVRIIGPIHDAFGYYMNFGRFGVRAVLLRQRLRHPVQLSGQRHAGA